MSSHLDRQKAASTDEMGHADEEHITGISEGGGEDIPKGREGKECHTMTEDGTEEAKILHRDEGCLEKARADVQMKCRH